MTLKIKGQRLDSGEYQPFHDAEALHKSDLFTLGIDSTDGLLYLYIDDVKTGNGVRINGIAEDIKVALLTIAEKAGYSDMHGQDYYDALYAALYPPAELLSITAVFTQGQNVVYDTDSLETLKQYLVVTAHYDDNTDTIVSDYTLSGTLAVGTSTVTVSFGGKTTTFTVTVEEAPKNIMKETTWSPGALATGDTGVLKLYESDKKKYSDLIPLNEATKVTTTSFVSALRQVKFYYVINGATQVIGSATSSTKRQDSFYISTTNASYLSPVEKSIPNDAGYIVIEVANSSADEDELSVVLT